MKKLVVILIILIALFSLVRDLGPVKAEPGHALISSFKSWIDV